jgi:hypothetical protein
MNNPVVSYDDLLAKGKKRKEQQIKAMHKSLLTSIYNAGGSVAYFSEYQDLRTTTVMELIELLAPNGIRFIFRKRRSKT